MLGWQTKVAPTLGLVVNLIRNKQVVPRGLILVSQQWYMIDSTGATW